VNKETPMMPVVRISEETWERMKAHARPFEDKPEDILKMALDALDEKLGRKPDKVIKPDEDAVWRKLRSATGTKLPQKEFRLPLMQTLLELGGSAEVSEIRRIMEKKMAPLLSADDYKPVSTGDPRWWNATCWERADLVREGLFADYSPRGVWELTDKGKAVVA
jgi:hypothetical protein